MGAIVAADVFRNSYRGFAHSLVQSSGASPEKRFGLEQGFTRRRWEDTASEGGRRVVAPSETLFSLIRSEAFPEVERSAGR